MQLTPQAAAYWQAFLAETGRDPDTLCFECFHFDLSEKWSNLLLQLVLDGKKRATTSSVPSYKLRGEPLPQQGDLSIITDYAGAPRCVIRTTAVQTLPFRDVTFDLAKREGEDENLDSWQDNHASFFTQEGLRLGFKFAWDMLVVFEDFEVVYR